jgi:hypothetical protein
MDGGIIESILIGAAVGGGTSALTGGDPLKGALMGGVTGGMFGGAGGAAEAAGTAGGTGITATNPLTAAGVTSGAEAGTTASSLVNAAQAAGAPIQGFAGTPAGAAIPSAPIPTGGISDLLQQPIGTATGGIGFKAPADFANPLATSGGSAMPQLPPSLAGMSQDTLWNTIGAGKAAGAEAAAAPKSVFGDVKDWWKGLTPKERLLYGAGGSLALNMLMQQANYEPPEKEKYKGPLSKFQYDPSYYTPTTVVPSVYRYADGGIASLGGGNIAVGGDPRRNPSPLVENSTPVSVMASGGIASLGSYSDGGRLLKGPGDGMSDHIPATIGRRQPARLAEGEFVVPADVVSHLGNGSTDAGAKQLYAMMNKVRRARTGNVRQGREINARKYLPA